MVHVYTNGDEPVPGYRLVKFLGRGGFGEVWKAIGPGGTQHALKLISLDGSQGLKEFRAIRLVKNVRHANLVPINAFWLKDDAGKLLDDGSAVAQADTGSKHDTDAVPAELIMAMGLGDKNLWDRLRECQTQGLTGIPAEELLDYMEGSARAIDHLNMPRHELGSGPVAIQHCDIKPQNIMIVADTAQVCDFGLARVLGDARTTAASLSAAYAAPEFISESKPSKWTDQYSLAISYYELRTGALPFDTGGGQWKIIKDKVDGKLDLSKLQEQEREVIARATHIEPIKRYPTTLEMVKALRRAYEGKLTDSGKTPASRGPLIVQKDVEIVPGYRLLRMLGRGSYGEVWEAAAPGGRRVALKIIQHLEAAEGKQEFKALQLIKNVDHEHLMELHAYWLLDKQGEIIPDELHNKPNAPVASILVIAGKLASKNLAQRLDECKDQGLGGIPVEELLRYIRQAAQAIDHLNVAQHKLDDKVVSIQHRDIKPENIMLAGNTVKVADFGLAKVVEGTSAVIHGDSAGLTLAYAAPEMFENRVTTWTDQYSLALSYYHLRTGTLPFRKGSSTHDIIRAHMEGRLDLSRLPGPELEVVRRATALTPEDRYATCGDMALALAEAAGAQPMESVMLPGSRLSTGTGTTPGRSSGTVSDPKRSDVRRRPQTAAQDVAHEDPFQTMQNVPRDLRTDAVETAEGGLLDTDRPPPDLTSVPPPWVTRDSARKKSKKVQIRIAITVTLGLVIGAIGLIVYTLWPKSETPVLPKDGPGPGAQAQIAQLVSEHRYREAHDKAGELPSAERGKAQADVIGKWKTRVEGLRDGGELEKAFNLADQGSFAENDRTALSESIRERLRVKLRNDFSQKRYQAVIDQADLILKRSLDSEVSKFKKDALAALHSDGLAREIAALIAKAAKATDPSTRKDLAEQIIKLDEKRVEGYVFKGQAQLAQAGKNDLEVGGADKTAKHARSLLAGAANADLDDLEKAILKQRKGIIGEGRLAALRKVIDQVVAADEQPNFNALLSQVKEAAGNVGTGLAKAVYAETIVWAKGSNITPAELKEADTAAKEAKVPEYPGYEKYVLGLVRHADKNPSAAAAEMVLAYQSPSAPLNTSYRTKRAADILRQAALAQRQDGVFIKRPLQVLDKKDKASAGTLDKLDQLYDWLVTLRKLAPTELSPELQINLALAGFYKSDSDPKARQTAMQVAADLLKEPASLGPLVYTLALHRAKLQEKNADTQAEAIKSYVQLLDLVKNRAGGRVAFGDVYAAVIVPIDTLERDAAKQAKPELKQQLARYHADVAGLLSNESPNALPEAMRKTRPQLVLDRFDRAVSLDKRPEYLVGRGYARCELPDADLNAARKDGEDAKTGAGEGLMGHVDLLLARREDDPKKRIPLLTQATESLRKALEQIQPTDPHRPALLTTRSAAFLELANADKDSNLVFNLGQAERLATEALTYVKRPNPEYAISARGNALEDLAWLAKQGDKWESAIANFTRAVDVQPDRAQPRLDRGRCQFKWVAEGGADKSNLVLAKTDLEDALSRSPTPAQEAETRFWLGGVLELQEDFAEAEKSLGRAVEIAKDNKLGDWTDFQLGWARLALNQAARDPRAAKRLSEARSRAQELRKLALLDRESLEIIQAAYQWEAHYALATGELAKAETAANELDKLGNKVLAAVFRGRVFEGRSQGKEALEAYSSGLPDPAQFEFKHVDLVQGRANFLMDYRWADLHSFKRDEILEQADRAVALAFGQEVGVLCDHLERRLNEIRQLRSKRDNARKDLTAKKQELAKAEEALAKTPGPAQEGIRDAKKREAADAAAEVDVLENTLKRVEPNALALAELLQRAEQKPAKPRAADDKTILERLDADIAIGIRHDAALKTRITKQLKDLRELAPQGPGGVVPADASQDRSLLAKARATAGGARRHLALSPTDTRKKETYTEAELRKKRDALHTAAIELLREAIKLAPNEPASVVWRMSFADSHAALYQRDKKADRRLEAEEALDLAAKMIGDNADFQKAIADVRKKFE